jgi:hypothetical protein
MNNIDVSRGEVEFDLCRMQDACRRCESFELDYEREYLSIGHQLKPLYCRNCYYVYMNKGDLIDRLYYLYLFISSEYEGGNIIPQSDRQARQEALARIHFCESMYHKLYGKLETIYGTERMQMLLYMSLFINQHIEESPIAASYFTIKPDTRNRYTREQLLAFQLQKRLQTIPQLVKNWRWKGTLSEWYTIIYRVSNATTLERLKSIDLHLRRPLFKQDWLDSFEREHRWVRRKPLVNGILIRNAGSSSYYYEGIIYWYDVMATEFDSFNRTHI